MPEREFVDTLVDLASNQLKAAGEFVDRVQRAGRRLMADGANQQDRALVQTIERLEAQQRETMAMLATLQKPAPRSKRSTARTSATKSAPAAKTRANGRRTATPAKATVKATATKVRSRQASPSTRVTTAATPARTRSQASETKPAAARRQRPIVVRGR